jgi:hypothetical protein
LKGKEEIFEVIVFFWNREVAAALLCVRFKDAWKWLNSFFVELKAKILPQYSVISPFPLGVSYFYHVESVMSIKKTGKKYRRKMTEFRVSSNKKRKSTAYGEKFIL